MLYVNGSHASFRDCVIAKRIIPRSQYCLSTDKFAIERYPPIPEESTGAMRSRYYNAVFSESDMRTTNRLDLDIFCNRLQYVIRIGGQEAPFSSGLLSSSSRFSSLLWRIARMRLNARKRCWKTARCIVSRFPRELLPVSRHDNKRPRRCCLSLSQYARARAVIASKQMIM